MPQDSTLRRLDNAGTQRSPVHAARICIQRKSVPGGPELCDPVRAIALARCSDRDGPPLASTVRRQGDERPLLEILFQSVGLHIEMLPNTFPSLRFGVDLVIGRLDSFAFRIGVLEFRTGETLRIGGINWSKPKSSREAFFRTFLCETRSNPVTNNIPIG